MEPGSGSGRPTAGMQREWLETLLDHLPVPAAAVGPAAGVTAFATRAAPRLAGGAFPTGTPRERMAADEFSATWPDGTPLVPDESPSLRAARGERLENVEIVWHTPLGRRSLL